MSKLVWYVLHPYISFATFEGKFEEKSLPDLTGPYPILRPRKPESDPKVTGGLIME
jgi:hypothetical protein